MKRFLINFRYAFIPRKPLLILRLIWNYILMLVFKKQLLRYVDLAIGYWCNLNCPHCFANKETGKGRMPPKFYAKVARDCMQMGAVNFSFQGGEPLLYNDLEDYIKAAQPHKNLISITTNGTLLTPGRITELKKWGVDILTISMDEFRPPNFPLWHHIDYAKRTGMKVTIATVVTHQNIDSTFLLGLRRLCQKKRIILFLIFAVPTGKWESRDNLMLTTEDVERIRGLERAHPYVRTDFQANYLRRGCGAGKEILYLNPYGDVFTCPFIPIPFGNVRRMPIKTIRNNMLEISMFKQYWPRCIAGEEGGLFAKLGRHDRNTGGK